MKQLHINLHQPTMRIAELCAPPKNWMVNNVEWSSICFSGNGEGELYQLTIPWWLKHKM